MDETYKKKVRAAEKLHEKARYLRGRFLNSVAVIERDIAAMLTEYFCTTDEEKRELFFSKVAEKLSLQKKKEIIIEIVKADYPRYWEENKERAGPTPLNNPTRFAKWIPAVGFTPPGSGAAS